MCGSHDCLRSSSLLPSIATPIRALLHATKVWTFDQLQGILYVIVPVRMTIIKLEKTEGGGLFVYAPVAPTGECMSMIRKLEAEHGPVKHIVLGTLALEHKVFAGPFAQRFSEAKVWFTPGQYRYVVRFNLFVDAWVLQSRDSSSFAAIKTKRLEHRPPSLRVTLRRT